MNFSDEQVVRIFSDKNGIMSLTEALQLGISRYRLYSMLDRHLLERINRGLYRLADLPPLGNPDLVTVALRIPAAVVCLVSALAYHELTDQVPHGIHIAIPGRSREPRLDYPPLHVYRYSKETYEAGIETYELDGTSVRIYSVPKTIADCFKFRGRIGDDIALEALREYRRSNDYNPRELMAFCRICRVERIVRTYLEAMN